MWSNLLLVAVVVGLFLAVWIGEVERKQIEREQARKAAFQAWCRDVAKEHWL